MSKHKAAVNTLAFSPAAVFLASAADDGDFLVYETDNWKLVCHYQGEHRIRVIAWDPLVRAIITWSSNGDINQLLLEKTILQKTENDKQWVHNVVGCVHAIETIQDSTQLAIGYNNQVILNCLIVVSFLHHGIIYGPIHKYVPQAEYNIPLNIEFVNEEGWFVAGAGVGHGACIFVRGPLEPLQVLKPLIEHDELQTVFGPSKTISGLQ
ncbi:hypothetical protein SERLA73DRAFT_152753 [Serpula lacrymans var. lacrymans S7.3]|uniref:Uncharacterized protein n=2 Tax=Serpula lacrymans var. lacrymans TaxID=341189 RepID=F8PYP7_SERL3|nr:uncharacterized protein SERLADRAFT_408511 [Serpula lacrymans var. lacrymans S7.9]EGN99010.1 hypothetical protein SERLA73DRAFT_152753 [Serpula lacrymans var. lacrymans S7.3]EGO24591.1 hypothetical protein SERLADRAFT_408511 [Serpula lacrymans var. lacrymans S7.9]